MLLALLVPQIGSAASLADAPAQAEPPPPTIEFVYPHANDKISDYPIYIETKVNNASLQPPVQFWGAVLKKDAAIAHIHYTLDDSPIFATRSTKIVMAKPSDRPLPLGKHMLRAELVYMNHENRNPRIFAEIPIICERPNEKNDSAAVPMDDRARRQLAELEHQVTELLTQILDLKSHVKDVPNP